MRRTLTSEPAVIGILTVLILILSLIPMFFKMFNTPAGREFIPVHNSLSDYPFYTAIIRQGIDGQWRVWGRFTAEMQERGGFVHYLYLLLGQAGRLVRVTDAHIVYHAARIVLGGIWLMAIYKFVHAFVRSRRARVMAFFMAAFSASWPTFIEYGGGRVVWGYMNWWSELDPFQRATFLPHFLVGHILMVVLFIAFLSAASRIRFRPYATIAIGGWIAGFVHPPSLIIVALTGPLWLAVTGKWKQFLYAVPAVSIAATSALFIRQEFSFFPWMLSQSFEGLSFALDIREYALALGPVLPLAALGAVIRRRDRSGWLLILWVAVSLIMLEAVRYFPFSPYAAIRAVSIANTRFLQVAVWVPLAILAAWGIEWTGKRFGRVLPIILICVFALLSLAVYPQSVRFQVEKLYGSPYFTYPTKGWMDAIYALRDITGPDDVVWSLPLVGQIIPSYVNRVVYTGNEVYYTKDLERKMRTSWGLYHGDLPRCDLYRAMKDSRVKAVFYGFDEQNASGDPDGTGRVLRTYPFLMPWKRFETTSVYLFTDVTPEECR